MLTCRPFSKPETYSTSQVRAALRFILPELLTHPDHVQYAHLYISACLYEEQEGYHILTLIGFAYLPLEQGQAKNKECSIQGWKGHAYLPR